MPTAEWIPAYAGMTERNVRACNDIHLEYGAANPGLLMRNSHPKKG